MSWNGSGVFNRLYSWIADKAAGLDISSTRMDADTNDIASNGFGNCLTRDGQGIATANLGMGNFRHTGVGNAVARSDYAALGQAQDGGLNWTAAGGTADALTATYTPSLTALIDGQLCFVRATAANATTTPTFAPNGLTARTITKIGGAALLVGDIPGNLAELVLRYNLASTRWELLNPAISQNAVSAINWIAGGGTADAITATYVPAITALIDGQLCFVRASAANATTTPTFAPNGLTARTITRGGGTALKIKDIAAAGAELVLRYNLANTRWELLNPAISALTAPTRQVLTSGTSQTYTTPAGATQLRIRFIGGGGGGGGSGSGGAPTSGGTGGTTSFNAITAIGGGGGGNTNGTGPGTGGVGGTGGAGAASLRIVGGGGQPGSASNGTIFAGPPGGNGFFGGAGAGGINSSGAGSNGATNSGGGGGGPAAAATVGSAGGGGGGEYAEIIINNPAATYTYSVGLAGTAGATSGGGGQSGGAGGSGFIVVEETYF